MLSRLRMRAGREEGFTLVELLVVMLILGILAAIAVPSFFSQRDKGRDAEAKSGARNAQTAMETYATDNDGSYTGADAAGLRSIEATLNDVDLSAVTPNAAGDGYTLTVTSDTDNTFSVQRFGESDDTAENPAGTVIRQCTVASTAGCPTGGDW